MVFSHRCSVGIPMYLPYAFLSLLRQIAASPTSNELPSTSTLLHDSISIPSPCWEYHGLRTVIFRTVMSLLISWWIFHAPEFWNVTPSSKIRSHFSKTIRLGRRKSLIAPKNAGVLSDVISPASLYSRPLSAPSVG